MKVKSRSATRENLVNRVIEKVVENELLSELRRVRRRLADDPEARDKACLLIRHQLQIVAGREGKR